MGEEVRMTEYDGGYGGGSGGGDQDRVFEWEEGLPNVEDLTPLCQMLISSELASAFRITPEPSRSMLDVNRASENTMSSLRDGGNGSGSGSGSGQLPGFSAVENDLPLECSDSRKVRKIAEDEAGFEEADSRDDDSSNATKTVKRARLVWTPQLHKRFIEVVARLGIKNAVPKTIMQFMNVEGLTRENVASHLQKYRLYLKRQHDGPTPPPRSPDHLFSSTPQVPQSLQQSGGHGQHQTSNGHFPMPYPPPQMMPMPMMGMAGHGGFHGYDMMQQRDWSGNNLGSYHHLPRNDKCQ